MTDEEIENITQVAEDWVRMEDQWPPHEDKRYLFYNKTLDIYHVTSLNGISDHFKRFRQEFRPIIDAAMNQDEEDELRFWIENRHQYSHWTVLKEPPNN